MAKKHLSDFEWVRLAASTDEARPVLTGVCVRGEELAATDGHRLHVAKTPSWLPTLEAQAEGGRPGTIFNPRTLERVEGIYPDYAPVFPNPTAAYEVDDLTMVLAQVHAAIAAGKVTKNYGTFVSVPTAEGIPVRLNALYVLDILKGRQDSTVELRTAGPLAPVTFDLSFGRRAVVMPVRVANGDTPGKLEYPLDRFLEPIDATPDEEAS